MNWISVSKHLWVVWVVMAGLSRAEGAEPPLKNLGGKTWRGSAAGVPVLLHSSTAGLKLEALIDGSRVTLSESEADGGVPLVTFSEVKGRLEVVAAKAWPHAGIPQRMVLERANPFDAAIGPAREGSAGSAETTDLGWVTRMRRVLAPVSSASALAAIDAALRELGADPLSTPWPVAEELAREVVSLFRQAELHRVKTGVSLDLRGDVRELVRLALLQASLLPAPAGLAAPARAEGLASKVLRAGTGKVHPDPNDWVLGTFTVWTTDGKQLDFSEYGLLDGKRLPWFPPEAHRVVAGELRRFWVPGKLAGRAEALIVFDVDVNGVQEVPNIPPTPPDVAAPGPDAVRSGSGLATVVLSPGTGKHNPRWGTNAVFHQTCWKPTGERIESSVEGQPLNHFLRYTLTGLGEALSLMVAGERRRAWLPPERMDEYARAHEDKARVCELELVKTDAHEVPVMSREPSVPPPDAKTASGLKYVVLTPGAGKRHPRANEKVEVTYKAWTSDGRIFASEQRLQEAVAGLPVRRASPGWALAVQRMVEGETSRFWIPKELSAHPGLGAISSPTELELTLIRIH